MDKVFQTPSDPGEQMSDARFEAMLKDQAAARSARYGFIFFTLLLVAVTTTVVVGIMSAGGAFNG